MKILKHWVLFTSTGTGLSVARRLQDEGVTVTVAMVQDLNEILPPGSEPCCEEEMTRSRRLDQYKGILDIYPAKDVFEVLMGVKDKTGYFIFNDTNDCCNYAEALEVAGFDGNFPHYTDLELESDRDAAREFVEEHYQGHLMLALKPEFQSVEEGLAFLEKNGDKARWALKGEEGVETTVPKDKDFLLAKEHVMQAMKDQKEKLDGHPFVLEQVIDDPVEITPEVWFWDGEPVWFGVDIEMKRIGAGDVGPMTGCSTDLVFPVEQSSKIVEMAFPQMVYDMAKTRKGWFVWDASILFDREGRPFFGEFCANRLGWDCFQTTLAMFPSAKEFFERLMNGERMVPEFRFGAAVRVLNMDKDGHERRVLRGAKVNWLPEVDGSVWPFDVMKDAEGDVVTCGSDWSLAVVTGTGDSPEEAGMDAYRNLEGFGLENYFVRPLEDFLSTAYPTSLINRFYHGDEFLWNVPS